MVAVGNVTGLGFRLAIYMLASLLVGMCLREYVRSRAVVSVGDPTPRLWGRVTWEPKSWFDPFGSGVLPALIAILWMAQALLIPAAYGKPAPIVALGVVAGVAFRVNGLPLESYRILLTLCFTSMSLTVFHLLPIPGLDGARMLALALPPDAARVYRDFDKYLPLMVLVIVFLLSSLALGLLTSISGALCDAATGSDCVFLLHF